MDALGLARLSDPEALVSWIYHKRADTSWLMHPNDARMMQALAIFLGKAGMRGCFLEQTVLDQPKIIS